MALEDKEVPSISNSSYYNNDDNISCDDNNDGNESSIVSKLFLKCKN